MKLRVIVDRLDLTKENDTKGYGDIIDVSKERAEEIMDYRFDNQKVVEPIYDIDDEILNNIKELEEENKNLVLKNEELEDKIKKLEEENTKIKEELNNNDDVIPEEEINSNVQNKKRKEDK